MCNLDCQLSSIWGHLADTCPGMSGKYFQRGLPEGEGSLLSRQHLWWIAWIQRDPRKHRVTCLPLLPSTTAITYQFLWPPNVDWIPTSLQGVSRPSTLGWDYWGIHICGLSSYHVLCPLSMLVGIAGLSSPYHVYQSNKSILWYTIILFVLTL